MLPSMLLVRHRFGLAMDVPSWETLADDGHLLHV
jgi:hypothetical protein